MLNNINTIINKTFQMLFWGIFNVYFNFVFMSRDLLFSNIRSWELTFIWIPLQNMKLQASNAIRHFMTLSFAPSFFSASGPDKKQQQNNQKHTGKLHSSMHSWKVFVKKKS